MNSNDDHGVHRNSARQLWAAVVKVCDGKYELIEYTFLNWSMPDRATATNGIFYR